MTAADGWRADERVGEGTGLELFFPFTGTTSLLPLGRTGESAVEVFFVEE